ncbi:MULTISPECIES: hypothetical protein [unclassified Frankia]|uniref:hypothetical protein n=1 Tax=unclassified Frankia TaxID=2632575 RepID=UPI002AD3A609|nr:MULTISPECIES: hypothetical protein [unclassified Frankia]
MDHPNPFRIMLTMRTYPDREREFEETCLQIGDRVTGHLENRQGVQASGSMTTGTVLTLRPGTAVG